MRIRPNPSRRGKIEVETKAKEARSEATRGSGGRDIRPRPVIEQKGFSILLQHCTHVNPVEVELKGWPFLVKGGSLKKTKGGRNDCCNHEVSENKKARKQTQENLQCMTSGT